MKKKILICTDYPSLGKPITGGIPRALYTIVQELKKIEPDYEFHICTLNSDVKKSTVISEENLFVHYIRFPLKYMPILTPKQITDYIISITIAEIQPDIVHAIGTGKDYAYPAVLWDPQRAIITVEGVIHEESRHWTGIKGKYHAITGRQMERFVLNRALNIISISPYVKKSVQPMTQGTISVIFNPVEPKFFTVQKDEVPNRLLFVGGIEERKGLDVLIRAVARIKKTVPDIELHIVGGVRKIVYFEKLRRLINSLDLEQNIEFLGSLPEKKLSEEYREAMIFVLPSYEESQGIVILEAMATSTPVVATRVGGIPDMIQDGTNGRLVDCGDDKQLADVIVSLLMEKDQRKRLGDAGKQNALQYLPEKIARQHLDVYNRILNQSS
jgi:glycosyltransferase involved in cell wall biosynthesis